MRVHPSSDLPDGLPAWLATFVAEAERETNTLRENGADQAATARSALTDRLVTAARAWLDAELDVAQAARERGICPETVRRAVRAGVIPDLRPGGRGHLKIRRRDLARLAGHAKDSYDPVADAQDIARLRSKP